MPRETSKHLISAAQMSPVTDSQIDHEPNAKNTTFAAVRFEHKDYDVTNYCIKFCPLYGWLTVCSFKQTLALEPEEAHLVTTTCCSTQTQRRPYGELGAVDHTKCLGCLSSFQFAETAVAPACCCAGDLVDEIIKELKSRMKARGDTGQIKRAEQLLGEIQILKAQAQTTDAKLDAILKHLNIDAPPATAAAVTQQPAMDR